MSELIKRENNGAMAKSGPKPVLDSRTRQRVCGMVAMGSTRREAAKLVGVHVSTISRAMERDEDFNKQMQEMELLARHRPLRAMYDAVEKHWRAAAWMLERKCPEEFGRRKPNTYTWRDVREIVDRLLEETLPMIPAESQREAVVLTADRFIEELKHPPGGEQVNPLLEFEAMQAELNDQRQQDEERRIAKERQEKEEAAAKRAREEEQARAKRKQEEEEAKAKRAAERRRKAK